VTHRREVNMNGLLVGGMILFVVAIAWLWVERWHLILPGTWPALKWLGFRRTLTGGLHGIWYGRHITSYRRRDRRGAARARRDPAGGGAAHDAVAAVAC
jgi:hypothetical protein